MDPCALAFCTTADEDETEPTTPFFDEGENNGPELPQASYIRWRRYKANFGLEKLSLYFPQPPAISQTNNSMTAYAYDHAVMYSLTGYYPPVGHIDPFIWFDEVLDTMTSHPFNLDNHIVYQLSCGDWVLDYVAHDYVQNLVIKSRLIVTPFNAYTLQCVKPFSTRDYFDYFLENFFIRCECNH